VLFVGVNPSLRSAEVGHHFARPGNRFWPSGQASGHGGVAGPVELGSLGDA
jgi:G:T/U-mismatch repair DNA glycosylase